MKSNFLTKLRDGISNFELVDSWRAKDAYGNQYFFSELLEHPAMADFVKAVDKEESFTIFDNLKIHQIGNSGGPISRKELSEWAVRRALFTDAETSANDVWRYRYKGTVPGYQVLFVDGLYFESSDDEADFTEQVRILPMNRAPVEALRVSAFERALFHDIRAIVCRPVTIGKSIRDHGAKSNRKIISELPGFDSLEDRVLLLSLVTKQGFQIVASAFVADDSVPRRNGIVYSPHSRRAPVNMAPPVIAIHTAHAEKLYDALDKFSGKKKMRLRVPLKKLNDHRSEISDAQAITDLRTCLEALYLDNSKEGEYRYRLALRAAFFAGEDVAAREKIFKAVRRCYDLGSEAVHTGSVNWKPEDYDHLKTTVGVVRKTLIDTIEGAETDFEHRIFGRKI